MFLIERHQAIVNLLNEVESVTVKELSHQLETGEATIRRDLAKLENSGFLKRTHGGAVLSRKIQQEIPFIVREGEYEKEKKHIARLASELINNGDFIILDSSSTTLRMVPHLMKYHNLKIMTNGARTAVDLAGLQNSKVYSTGGSLREKSLSFTGQSAGNFVKTYNAHILFFSCRALSREKGLSDFDEEEASLRRDMIESAEKKVLLCDHSKLDQNSFYRIGPVDCVDIIVTDKEPSPQWVHYLKEKNIELIY